MPEPADWERLGEMLQQQRVRLAPRYRNRALFARERGVNYRLSLDIETGARDNYGLATLTHIELAYGWQPGSIAAVLAGGRPSPAQPPGEAPLTPACRYERAIMDEDLADDVKQSIIRAHRSTGHTSWCDPGPARPEAAVPGALSAAGN
jgi:hypothetical protein